MDTRNRFDDLVELLEVDETVNPNTSGITLDDDVPEVLDVLVGAIDTVYDYVSKAIYKYYAAQVESRRLAMESYVPGMKLRGLKFREGSEKWSDLLIIEGSKGDDLFYASAFTGHEQKLDDSKLGLSDYSLRRFDTVEVRSLSEGRMLNATQFSGNRRDIDVDARTSEYLRLKSVFGGIFGSRTYLRLTSSSFTGTHGEHSAIMSIRDPEASGYIFDVDIDSNFTSILGLLHSNVIISHRLKTMSLSELAKRAGRYNKAELKGCDPEDQLTFGIQARIYNDLMDMVSETRFNTVDCLVPIVEFKVLNSMVSAGLDADQSFAGAALATSKRTSLVYSHASRELYIRGPKDVVSKTLVRCETMTPKLSTFVKGIRTAAETVLNESSLFGILVSSQREDPIYGYLKLGSFERLNYRWDKKTKVDYVEVRNGQGDVIGTIPKAEFMANGIVQVRPGATYSLVNMKLSKEPEVISIKHNGTEVILQDNTCDHWEHSESATTGLHLVSFNKEGVVTLRQGSLTIGSSGVMAVDDKLLIY